MTVIDYRRIETVAPLSLQFAISLAEAQIERRPTGARRNVIEARLRLLRAEKARRAVPVGFELSEKLARSESGAAAC